MEDEEARIKAERAAAEAAEAALTAKTRLAKAKSSSVLAAIGSAPFKLSAPRRPLPKPVLKHTVETSVQPPTNGAGLQDSNNLNGVSAYQSQSVSNSAAAPEAVVNKKKRPASIPLVKKGARTKKIKLEETEDDSEEHELATFADVAASSPGLSTAQGKNGNMMTLPDHQHPLELQSPLRPPLSPNFFASPVTMARLPQFSSPPATVPPSALFSPLHHAGFEQVSELNFSSPPGIIASPGKLFKMPGSPSLNSSDSFTIGLEGSFNTPNKSYFGASFMSPFSATKISSSIGADGFGISSSFVLLNSMNGNQNNPFTSPSSKTGQNFFADFASSPAKHLSPTSSPTSRRLGKY